MAERKHVVIYFDTNTGYARWCLDDHHWDMRDGFSDRNIDQLVQVMTDRGYHTTLYRIANPQFFAEKKTS